MATSWETIETTLQTWLAAITGLSVQWSDRDQEAAFMLPARAELVEPDAIHNLGEDWIEFTPSEADPNQLVETQVGNRVFSVGVRVLSSDQRARFSARQYLEKAKGSLKLATTLSAFRGAGLAIVRSTKVMSYNAPIPDEDRMRSIALFQLELACVMAWAEPTAATIGTIGSIGLSSNVAGTAPPDLQDEILTPP